MTMIKLQYLVRSGSDEGPGDFGARIRREVLPRLMREEPSVLTLTITDRAAAHHSLVPYRGDRLALISLQTDESSDAALRRWNGIVLDAAPGLAAGYLVRESQPRHRVRQWPAGTVSPGLGMVTLFRARRGLDRAAFIRRWHEGHSPLALRVHPLCQYVRNVVEAAVFHGSPPCDGIVEEFCATDVELLSLPRFFGGPARMLPNMLRIGLDIRTWMDLGSIENYLANEYRCRD